MGNKYYTTNEPFRDRVHLVALIVKEMTYDEITGMAGGLYVDDQPINAAELNTWADARLEYEAERAAEEQDTAA